MSTIGPDCVITPTATDVNMIICDSWKFFSNLKVTNSKYNYKSFHGIFLLKFDKAKKNVRGNPPINRKRSRLGGTKRPGELCYNFK